MRLSEIQPRAVAALKAAENLSTAVILEDDGTYPDTPLREDAVQSRGIAIVVWDPQPAEGGDQVPDGSGGIYGTHLFVVVEENVKRSRLAATDGGAEMRGIQAVDRVIEAIKGIGGEVNPNFGAQLASPPYRDFGTQNGLRRWLVQFDVSVPF